MSHHNRLPTARKLFLSAGVLSLAANTSALAQVNTWTGNFNLWDNQLSWVLGLPTNNQTQRIELNNDVGETIYLRSSTAGSVDAGTIELIGDNYQSLYSSATSGIDTTINFGTNSGINYDSTSNKLYSFYFGTFGDGTIIMSLANGGSLSIRSVADNNIRCG
jgi:hypothetical protein